MEYIKERKIEMKGEIEISNKIMRVCFDSERFYIKKIKFRGNIVSIKSGIELGDWFNYFSQEKKKSALKGEIINYEIRDHTFRCKWKIGLNRGVVYFTDSYSINSNILIRNTCFEIKRGTYVGDLVQRWIIRSPKVFINNEEFNNDSNGRYNENIFRKEKKNEIYFKTNHQNILINLISRDLNPKDLSYLPYIRSLPQKHYWVLHNRYKCLKGEECFIKGCINCYNKPIPELISELLLNFSFFKNKLLYIREKKIPNFPFQAVYNKLFLEEKTFKLTSKLKFI